jgi:antitoxin component of MazEF toxin-antitoxin module
MSLPIGVLAQVTDYVVQRKLQEQAGSFHVNLPKLWVEAQGLKESDSMTVTFNGAIRIEPTKPHGKGAKD